MHPGHCGGLETLSSSDVPCEGYTHDREGQRVDHVAPKPCTKEDIARLMKAYKVAAQNAKDAGFDGVELHGANGYLVD